MTIKEFIRKKIFGKGTAAQVNGDFDEDRLTFINNDEELMRQRLKEYEVWYYGDSDELLNYYTHENTINYNYEPYYARNKRSYFWAISSTETDIKRTHSGQPRNIIDTLVGICRFPVIKGGMTADVNNNVNASLQACIRESNLIEVYKQEQLPLTLVDGWGCYKINWNKDISDYPYVVYYKAENVDFIYKAGRITSIIFKDYYVDDKGQKYMLTETRSTKYDKEKGCRYLAVEYELFKKNGDDLRSVPLSTIPELVGVENFGIDYYDSLLAVPCIIYKNTGKTCGYGRSIFTGKIDLFDDLDQALSQGSNSVRKSTPIEYFNSEFLERDKQGMPIMPKAYDRKYTMYTQRAADGSVSGNPVQVTQPQITFSQYNDAAIQIMLQIINGVMSPATLGIDIAKKDNAEAQREKEKVTIFTRNGIIDTETEILKKVCNELLCAKEFMDRSQITVKQYDISIRFSEFADDSFENKLKELGAALDGMCMSEDMYMEKLYGDTLSESQYQSELEFLRKNHTKPHADGMTGFAGGGQNIPGAGPNPLGVNEENADDNGDEENLI